MNQERILDQIGVELLRAAVRRRARVRRNRVAASCVAGMLLTGGVAVAAVSDRGMLADLPLLNWMQPGEEGIRELDLETEGQVWRVSAYRSKQGALCQTTNPTGTRARTLGCQNGFVLAENFAANGAPVTYGVETVSKAGPMRTLLISGVAGDAVQRVDVRSGSATGVVTLSADHIAIPVEVDPGALTDDARRRAAAFPDMLRLRLYATAIKVAAATGALELRVETTAGVSNLRIPANVLPQD